MKTITVPIIAFLCVHLWSCASTYTKTTYPDGRIEEVTVKGVDPQAGALAGTAAGVVINSTSSK